MSFRAGLLAGQRIAVAGGAEGICVTLAELGANLEQIGDAAAGDEAVAAAWAAERPPLHGLVVDARSAFGSGGEAGLAEALERTWICARALATAALIPGGAGGRLIFIAPAADAGALAGAAQAGLENLARTLGVEWARYGVLAVAVCPGPDGGSRELADLVAFLLSEAGGYFTGCRFDLSGSGAPPLILSS